MSETLTPVKTEQVTKVIETKFVKVLASDVSFQRLLITHNGYFPVTYSNVESFPPLTDGDKIEVTYYVDTTSVQSVRKIQ